MRSKRFLIMVCLFVTCSQGHGMTCLDMVGAPAQAAIFVQPRTSRQLVEMLQSRYHSLARVRDQEIHQQREVVTDVLSWMNAVIPASTFLSEQGQHALYTLRAELIAWSEKLSHAEKTTPVYWTSFSKMWLSSVSVLNQVQGRLQAISTRKNRQERERLHKLSEVWGQIKGTFSGRKKAERTLDLLPFLQQIRGLLVQIASLGGSNSSTEKLQAQVELYLESLPRIARQPVTKITTLKIWDHFQRAASSLRDGGEVQDLPVVALAEAELKELEGRYPKESLVDLQKWSLAFIGVLEWWLYELPAHNDLARRKTTITRFYKTALEEINSFIKLEHKATEASLAEMRNALLLTTAKLTSWKEFGEPTVPKLVRIPKNDDPGDDPHLLAFDLFLMGDAPEMLKSARDAVNLAYSLRTLYSVLHWLSALTTDKAVQEKLNALVEEAKKDSQQPAILVNAALEARSSAAKSRNREAYRMYETYYTAQLRAVREMLPAQSFSGMNLSPTERLMQTMGVLAHYIQYLQGGSWNFANIYEVFVVGRVVFTQFTYVQEYFKSDGAKQLTNQIKKQFGGYLESIARWTMQNQTLDLDKDNAVTSFERMYEALEVVLKLEDSSYRSPKRKEPPSTSARDESVEDWTKTPLPYERWIASASKDILKMSESGRSLQWALYVFKLKQFPPKEQRKEMFRALGKRFHPDSGGEKEAMQIVNAANDILKLYEE